MLTRVHRLLTPSGYDVPHAFITSLGVRNRESKELAMRRIAGALTLSVLLAGACTESSVPTTPALSSSALPRTVLLYGAHVGNPRFHFLPPIGNPAPTDQTFDPQLEPTVTICLLDANGHCTGAPTAAYTLTSGPDGDMIQVEGASYRVNWHASRYPLSNGQTYRITVSIGGADVGVADARVAHDAKSGGTVAAYDGTLLIDGARTIPIAFFAAVGLVTRVAVSPATVTLALAATQQFVAAAYDAHGNVVAGRDVTWLSDNTSVATSSSTGLITAVAPGTASIRASVDGVSGDGRVTVSEPDSRPVLASGWYHTCRVASDGHAYCWGVGANGQLGNGSTSTSAVQVPVSMAALDGRTFTSIAAGSYHSCGLTNDGAVYCWGSNTFGELGNGSSTAANLPVAVLGGPYIAVSAGSRSSCAIDADHALFCWGANTFGTLGNGSNDQVAHPVPTRVDPDGALKFARVALNGTALYEGEAVVCGVTTSNATYCWGAYLNKYLGTTFLTATANCGGFQCGVLPSRIALDAPTSDVIVGGAYGCVLTTAGDAACWGNNLFGSLGVGTALLPQCGGDPLSGFLTVPCSPTPRQVTGGHHFVRLGQGFNHACAIDELGVAYCWGQNVQAQLGTVTIETCYAAAPCATAPRAVNTSVRFKSIAGGVYHACGLGTDDIVYCWGSNYDGYAEDGTGGSPPTAIPTAIR